MAGQRRGSHPERTERRLDQLVPASLRGVSRSAMGVTPRGRGAQARQPTETWTRAREGGKNIWVQSTAPTAEAVGDLWIDTT